MTNSERSKGKEWVDGLRELCKRTGIPFPNKYPSTTSFDASAVYEAFTKYCCEALLDNEKMMAMVLEQFGLDAEGIQIFEIGYLPGQINWKTAKDFKVDGQPLDLKYYEKTKHPIYLKLRKKFSQEDIKRSNVFYDTRWIGRVIGPWRKKDNTISTFWARSVDKDEKSIKYLYLKNGSKSEPYLSHLLDDSARLVMVESIKDAITLMDRGVQAVALGSTEVSANVKTFLRSNYVKEVTLCFEHDPKLDGSYPGMEGTIKAVKGLPSSQTDIKVVCPNDLGSDCGKKEKMTTEFTQPNRVKIMI